MNADTARLRTLGNEVQSEAGSYKTEVNNIYATVDNLRTVWNGADNQAFVTKVTGYREEIENLGKVVDSYGDFLLQVAKVIDNTQNEIASAAGKL